VSAGSAARGNGGTRAGFLPAERRARRYARRADGYTTDVCGRFAIADPAEQPLGFGSVELVPARPPAEAPAG
jgi:hypothetical protein